MTATIKSEPTNGHLTPAEAKAILQQEAQQRAEACRVKVQAVLDEYECTIDVAVLLRANQIIPRVEIVAK